MADPKHTTVKISDLPSVDVVNDGAIMPLVQSGITYKVGAVDFKAYVLDGSSGFQGNQGYQGSQGSSGAQGATGSSGPAGAQGSQGSSGAGAQGAQGDEGIAGFQGNDGAQGSSGISGAQGDAGAQGFQGDSGTVGTINFAEGTSIPSAANIDNYSLSSGALFKLTGTTSSAITGFANGTSGRYILVVNNTDKNQTFNQESLSSSASNRFVLGVSNKTIGVNQTATFIYVTGLTVGGNGSQSRWILTAVT